MSRKLLAVLFLCTLIPWTVGNGLLPLLPVFAGELGAGRGFTGLYLAISYFALVLGSLAAGWVSNRLQHRKRVLIVCSAVSLPAVWLTGRASTPWQLVALTVLTFFIGGLCLALTTILAGLFSEKHERGRVFGILALTSALGALIGGGTFGIIVDRWGFPGLSDILTVFWALLPLLGLLLEDKPVVPQAATSSTATSLGRAFYLIIASTIIASLAMFVGRLGTSLVMADAGFARAAISSTAAVGGLIALPLTPLVGWLSDRFNRKLLLGLCYVAGACGLAVLSMSTALWQFWVAASLISIQGYAGVGIGSALIADTVPGSALDRGLSGFNSALFLGGILGFGLSGIAGQQFGLDATLKGSAIVALVAIAILALVRVQRGAGDLPGEPQEKALREDRQEEGFASPLSK